jgi:hypothetical protein
MFNVPRCLPPLPDDEVEDIVTAICNRELQRRGLSSEQRVERRKIDEYAAGARFGKLFDNRLAARRSAV